MPKPFSRPILSNAIRDYIIQYIVDNDLRGGDALPSEAQLAEELGVARSSVREATRALQSLGIIGIRQGEGTYVREYNFDSMTEILRYGLHTNHSSLSELMQIRLWLEPLAAEEVVMKVSSDSIERMDAILDQWDARRRTGQLYDDLDADFHRVLYAESGNETLNKLLDVFWSIYKDRNREGIAQADPDEIYRLHREIVTALRRREPGEVRRLLARTLELGIAALRAEEAALS